MPAGIHLSKPLRPLPPMMLTTGDLKRRKWTPSMILKFASAADQVIPNPHHPRGAPIRFFELVRINSVESTAEFIAAMATTNRRRAGKKGNTSGKAQSEIVRLKRIVRDKF